MAGEAILHPKYRCFLCGKYFDQAVDFEQHYQKGSGKYCTKSHKIKWIKERS